MKRPLALYAASAMLLAKGVMLFVMAFSAAPVFRLSLLTKPGIYATAAVWLYLQPKWARWFVGAFFFYAALRQAVVLPTFSGTTLDLVRRPFSLAMAAWFAYALLVSSAVRTFADRQNQKGKVGA
jgi:hypothetical protein